MMILAIPQVQRFYSSTSEVLAILRHTLLTCVRGPRRANEILGHMVAIGIYSLPIVAVSTAFAGVIVTNEIAFHMDMALHSLEMIPGLSAQFVFRELGIAIPCCLLVSKVGAATTAEVASMKITEQIDALRLLQIDPVEYLVYPRFVASVIAVGCLTVISIFITLGCAMILALAKFHFGFQEYINALNHFISSKEILWALIKGMTYGAVMPIISCFYGFNCKGGAEGVGSATTNSVVTSTIIIIVLDFILTFIFSHVS